MMCSHDAEIKAAGAPETASMRTHRLEDMGTGHRQSRHRRVGTGREGTLLFSIKTCGHATGYIYVFFLLSTDGG